MSLGDPLVLKDSTGTDVNFDIERTFTNKDGSNGTDRVDRASSAIEPRKLKISQIVSGKGATRVRRTLIQYTKTVLVAGVPSQLTANLTLVFPLNGAISTTDVSNAICCLADAVLTTGSLAVDTTKTNALLQGQS